MVVSSVSYKTDLELQTVTFIESRTDQYKYIVDSIFIDKFKITKK